MATLIVSSLVFAAIVFVALTANRLAGERRRALLARLNGYNALAEAGPRAPVAEESILRRRQFSAIPLLQRILSSGTYAEHVAASLGEAGIPLRVGEYLLFRAISTGASAIFVHILGFPVFLAGGVGLGAFYLPQVFVSRRQTQRLHRFDDTLVDALTMMANALKSGSSFLQAMDLVSHEMPPPLSEEFARTVGEIRVGASVEAALESLTRRMKSYDLYLVVTAIVVQRQTGGSLAEILDKIAYTIRERMRILRQVQILTAQERMSAIVVGSLPVTLLILLSIISPSYYGPFLADPLGQVMLGIAFGFEVCGFLLMNQLGKIDV